MKLVLLHIIIFIGVSAIAQKKDSSSGCSYTVKLKYPELAIENNISGVVIVEMDRDENCGYQTQGSLKELSTDVTKKPCAWQSNISPGVINAI